MRLRFELKGTKKIGLLVLLIALMMTGCRENPPVQHVGLPLSLCLPASEVQSASRMPVRRSPGDPGQTELFLFPHHLYIIIMKNNGDDTWSVWEAVERNLTDADWQATHYIGLLPTTDDSIYQYKEEIQLLLPAQRFEGRVYAVASAEPLSFSKSPLKTAIGSMDDLLNLTFDVSTEAVQSTLQHIYSTPYNLELSGSYYGSFSASQVVPHLRLLLYHVAAKVDIKWNVDKSKRPDGVRLTSMKAQNLFASNAYCFKPMENMESDPLGSGYERVLIKPMDEGLWWEGRAYFYTIPYTTTDRPDYFPLQMELQTNGSTGTGYKPTIFMEIDKSSPFVPWLRADFKLSAPLEDKEETKVINISAD